jgi:hypothetical protein
MENYIYYNSEIDRHERKRKNKVKKGIEKRFKRGEISETQKDNLLFLLK